MNGEVGTELAAAPASGPPRRPILWVAVSVGVVLAILVIVLATRPSSTEREADRSLLGQAVPEVVGVTIDGTEFDIDSQRGRWVVVNFVASWCTPCIAEHPELVAFAEEHEAVGDAVLVGVPFQDSRANLVEFFEERGGSWPVLDPDGGTGRIAIDFGVTALPETFVVSPEGIVVWKATGQVTAPQLDGVIAAARGDAG